MRDCNKYYIFYIEKQAGPIESGILSNEPEQGNEDLTFEAGANQPFSREEDGAGQSNERTCGGESPHQEQCQPGGKSETALVQARIVEGGLSGVYALSNNFNRAKSCPTLSGFDPRNFRGAAAEEVLMGEIRDRITKEKENIVLLGNNDSDVQWILDSLSINDPNLLTVYSPTENNIQESDFLKLRFSYIGFSTQ